MGSKSPQAFRTIREVADWLGIEAHVLRFWESKFTQIKPVKRAGGRRYYRPADMRLVGGIKVLLHDQGLTIRGAQKMIREDGIAHVSALSPALDDEIAIDDVYEAETTEATGPPAETPPAAVENADLFDADAAQSSEPPAAQGPTPVAPAERSPEIAAAAPDRAPEPADDFTREVEETISATTPTSIDLPINTAVPAATPTATPTAEEQVDSTDIATTEPLSALHELVTNAHPLNAKQLTDIAPHVARLQALADRLSSKSRSA